MGTEPDFDALERYHACPYCCAALATHAVTPGGESMGDTFTCGTVIHQLPPYRSDQLSDECKRRTRMLVAIRGGGNA